MKGKRKIVRIAILFFGIFLICATCLFVYGGNVQKTYVDDTGFESYVKNNNPEVIYYHYPFDEMYDVYGGGKTIKRFQELKDSADLIIRAKLVNKSNRKIYQECIFSEIEVLDSYHGGLKPGSKIHLFEPVNCTGLKGKLLCSEGYSPMQEGDEYVLFLKQLQNSLFSEDEFVYIPSTITYSKYRIGNQAIKRFRYKDLEKGSYKYKNIKEEEVFLSDKNMYELFVKLKHYVNYDLRRNNKMKYGFNVYQTEVEGHVFWVAESKDLKGCVG